MLKTNDTLYLRQLVPVTKNGRFAYMRTVISKAKRYIKLSDETKFSSKTYKQIGESKSETVCDTRIIVSGIEEFLENRILQCFKEIQEAAENKNLDLIISLSSELERIRTSEIERFRKGRIRCFV